MAHVTYLRRSGLVVAEESHDETRLQRALEHLDHRLILTRELDRKHGMFVWKVHVNWATDRPAMYVCDWRDANNRPLPLSSGLIEKVKAQLALGPDGVTLADRRNAEHEARLQRDIDTALADVASFVAAGARKHHVPKPSVKLRMIRDKQRARGLKV